MRAYADPSVLAPVQAFADRANIQVIPYAGAKATLSRAHQGSFVPSAPVSPELAAALAEAEVIFGLDFPPDLLARAPRLRWVHTASAGVDHLGTTGLIGSGVTVTTNRGLAAEPIAEFALMGMLALTKRLPAILEAQRAHRWQMIQGQAMSRLTAGILGLGAIGSAVARLCKSLGMRVLATRRHVTACNLLPEHVDRLYSAAEMGEVLQASDFVILTLPLLPDTHHLIGAAELAQMKPTAILVNLARGAIVDEAALVAAVREGRIGGAFLDTFEVEPLPPESPLWDLPNTIISPHTSAYQPDGPQRGVALFCQNLARYLNDEPLLNQVDPARGY